VPIISEGTKNCRTKYIKKEANFRNSSAEIEKFAGRLKDTAKRMGSAAARR
jgi:hypothetical protein